MHDISIEDNLQRRMHITSGMLKANVGDNPELIDRKVAPALEVVTHCGLNGNLSCLEIIAAQIHIAEHLHINNA